MTPTLPFPDPRARRTDPRHSHEAAKSATPTTACAGWLRYQLESGRDYRDEDAVALCRGLFTGPTIRRTIRALIDAGELVCVGEGKTAAKHKCRLWRRA